MKRTSVIATKTHMLFCRVNKKDKMQFVHTCRSLGRTQSDVIGCLVRAFLRQYEGEDISKKESPK